MIGKGWDSMQKELRTNIKKKIVFIVELSSTKGYYPLERASILAKHLNSEEDVTVLLKNAGDEAIQLFTDAQLSPILYDHFEELINQLESLKPDLVIVDGKDSFKEQVESIRPLCKT